MFGCQTDSVPWMSLKKRSERPPALLRAVTGPRPRLRVLPLFVASRVTRSSGTKIFLSNIRLFPSGDCPPFPTTISLLLAVVVSGRDRLRRDDKASTTTPADLAALSAGISRFVGGPFVGRPLFVRGASALTGDLALFFWRHRSESAAFLAFSCIHRQTSPGWSTVRVETSYTPALSKTVPTDRVGGRR